MYDMYDTWMDRNMEEKIRGIDYRDIGIRHKECSDIASKHHLHSFLDLLDLDVYGRYFQ